MTMTPLFFSFYQQLSPAAGFYFTLHLFCNYNLGVVMINLSPQKTSTCCLQTGSQEKRRRVSLGNKWSTLLTRVWKEQAWSSTRSRPSPLSTTSNMTMTFIFMSMTLSKPPRDSGHFYLIPRHLSTCYCSTHCYNLLFKA